MRGSIAERVADHVAALPERSFVAVRDVDGSRSAVESAFSRLAADGDVLRIRKGLYWKGATAASGISPPRVEEVALALGGPGSGPAGVAAAQWLGLTSQAPSTYLTAVPARAPAPFTGIRFSRRPVERLLHSLMPSEVAVLEVLRVGPAVVESDWENLPELIAGLAASGAVRLPHSRSGDSHGAPPQGPLTLGRVPPHPSRHVDDPTTRARSQWPSGCTIGSAATDNQRRSAFQWQSVPSLRRWMCSLPGFSRRAPDALFIHMREVELGTGRPDAVLVVVSSAGLESRLRKGLRLPSLAHARVLESIRTGAPSGYSRRHSSQLTKSLQEIGWLTHRDQVREVTNLVARSLVVEAKISDWRRGIGQLAKARWACHDGALLMPMDKQHRVSRPALRHNRLGLLVARSESVEWRIRPQRVELRRMADLWLTELAIRSLETG